MGHSEAAASLKSPLQHGDSLKLLVQLVGSSLEESPLPGKAIAYIALGKGLVYLVTFRSSLGLVCFLNFLNLRSLSLFSRRDSLNLVETAALPTAERKDAQGAKKQDVPIPSMRKTPA